jgi:hypothetical protein
MIIVVCCDVLVCADCFAVEMVDNTTNAHLMVLAENGGDKAANQRG